MLLAIVCSLLFVPLLTLCGNKKKAAGGVGKTTTGSVMKPTTSEPTPVPAAPTPYAPPAAPAASVDTGGEGDGNYEDVQVGNPANIPDAPPGK